MRKLITFLMVAALFCGLGVYGGLLAPAVDVASAANVGDDMVFEGTVEFQGTTSLNGGTIDAACTSAQILVDDGTDLACVSVSGDATIATSGALTIGASAVGSSEITDNTITSADILNSTISLEDLDAGITPGYIIRICNTTAAEDDDDGSVTEAYVGIAATDIIVASMANSTASVFINSTTPSTNQIVFGLSGNGGVDTRINYCANKAAQ